MNRRDFLKSLPFIGVLATAVLWREPSQDAVTAYDLNEYAKRLDINLPGKSVVIGPRSETTWKVVNLGQPVTGVVNWDNRMYAVGTDGDIFVSDNCFSTWTKVESGHIDSYIDSIHKF